MNFEVRGNFDSRQLMNQNRKLKKEKAFAEELMGKFADLARGCDEHPQNRFQRSPKSDCEECERLFKLAEEVALWDQ